MSILFYGHPFASYCQKVLIAIYETKLAITWRLLSGEDPAVSDELKALWPFNLFPVIVDDGAPVIESSIIIEHLQLKHGGPVKLLPPAADRALEVRFMDRFFDGYVMQPMQQIVANSLRKPAQRDPLSVPNAEQMLGTAYAWLEARLGGRRWAAGDDFSMADCAAAPALFYADWVHEIPQQYAALRSYRARVLAHPSVARVVDEARPYRKLFPLGAPDRD